MELLVYSADWCRDCREAKRFLNQHAIPYTEINIETTPGAAAQVIANTGKRAIPQFVLDGSGFSPTNQVKAFSTTRWRSYSAYPNPKKLPTPPTGLLGLVQPNRRRNDRFRMNDRTLSPHWLG
jgi:mycoredoxin